MLGKTNDGKEGESSLANLELLFPAAITTILGIFMMLPPIRRRAEARGMSGDIIIPGMIAITGSVLFLVGLYI